MRHMNRMFEQDFLYVKTAITAINNEWHEMWLSFNRFLKGMKQMIEDFNWDMKHRMDEAKKQFDYYYGQYSMQLKNKVNEFHEYCKQKCEMLYERAMEMKTEIALWAYNYWDVRDNVLGLKKTLYKFGAEKIKEIKDIVTDVGMNTLIFDPKRGEIIVEIRFGAAKYAYNHFMSSVEDLERAVMKLSNLMPNIDLNVWDIYYMMKPSSDLYDYIPPFKAEATLFAGQHITTFDGRHLNYKATCSYLLARDFVDGNFSVVANFDADRRAKTLKSLSLTTAHNEQVEIFPNNKVFYNRQMVKLPLKLTDATVTRQDNLIVVESKRGYKVMCDHDIQLYTVQISGWYFNKMAGLFGNYNNEPEDDMLMSNNRYTNDLEKFAQSWSVSRQCRSHRNFAPSHMVPENRDCAHFFLQSDSPFRYCFKQVNPDQFYKTCAMQLSFSKATSIDLCYVIRKYESLFRTRIFVKSFVTHSRNKVMYANYCLFYLLLSLLHRFFISLSLSFYLSLFLSLSPPLSLSFSEMTSTS
ncbi:unnamed protein product [Acanthosepion pharaonis]|uniref:VWFD domain-containing protein n=1 Tax=Acanthosepion pharaonis TaxID=158019 RepID=A0A812CK45_ACAPH|nr:unnamed protein product [Sepia pharaonis]